MNKGLFATLQGVGKALMLPVSVLPAAGLMLGIGSSGLLWSPLAEILKASGGVIFSNLPLIFAVGVAISGGEAVAALAAIVGYLVMLGALGAFAPIIGLETKLIMGIPSIEVGVFGGIVMGIVASGVFKKYHNIQLPDYLGFFSGKRFVPIMTALCGLIVASVLALIWPPIASGIHSFSEIALSSSSTLMVFTYGVVERLLIPFGLHHIWNVPFFFELGSFSDAAGKVIHGDISRFFAGDPAAGFLGGGYLFKMFGLPAAAIAMWHCAKPENKKVVGGIMLSAAFTSFLTGITEPIEFAFLFVAPLLFFVHALLAGLSFAIFDILGAKLGMTFSHGFIDYLLYYRMDTKPWMVLAIGPAIAVLYYFIFRTLILRRDYKTPGRDDSQVELSLTFPQIAARLVSALGGKANIVNIDACITRLRLELKDQSIVNREQIDSLNPSGVMSIGRGMQIVFGTHSDIIKTEMKNILADSSKVLSEQRSARSVEGAMASPMKGAILNLESVPDQVFSQKMLGDGFAVDPVDGDVFAPVSGEIITVFATKHAIGIRTDAGKEVLIHVGIDTVKLNGEGFSCFVKKGDYVLIGDKLISVDFDAIKGKVPSLITPVVVTNLSEKESVEILAANQDGFVAQINP